MTNEKASGLQQSLAAALSRLWKKWNALRVPPSEADYLEGAQEIEEVLRKRHKLLGNGL